MNKPRKPSRPTVIRALGYIRVSTRDQSVNGAGLDAQRQAVTAEIERRGWTLAGIVEDAGQSGTVKPQDRPGLGEALRMLDAGEADALVSLKIDRVSRSVLDFAALVNRSDAQGWQLVTLDMPLDADSPVGRATRNMLATFAQLERDFIAQRTQEALAIRKEQNWPNGRPGHERTVRAEVVTQIRGMRTGGYSWRTIADLLNAENVPSGQGGIWHPMTCKRIAEDSSR
jgi:DNA invertase Pin-like site-specific DNA recombinase